MVRLANRPRDLHRQVEVFALNEAAKNFYLKFGFRQLLDDEQHLYLPMKLIGKQVKP